MWAFITIQNNAFFCLSDFLMSRSKEKQEIPSNWSLVVVEVGLLVKVMS